MQENIQDTDILRLSNKRLCLCGCETVIDSIDSHGRPRHYVLGHNRRHHKTRDPLLKEINKIKSLDEAYCIMQTQAIIINQQVKKLEELGYEWMDD